MAEATSWSSVGEHRTPVQLFRRVVGDATDSRHSACEPTMLPELVE
jgi:hypothetical protein